MKKLSDKLKNLILIEYSRDMPIIEICNKYKITVKTFYHLKNKEKFQINEDVVSGDDNEAKEKDNVKIKEPKFKPNKIKNFNKKCNVNFFKLLDNVKSAYWAGFITGDGYISDNNTLQIGLALVDLSHLEKFKKDIKSTHKISKVRYDKVYKDEVKELERCSISIKRSKLIKDLAIHGITKDKSIKCSISKTIPKEMLHHYMRGVFDADGSFCVSNTGDARFSICSSVKSYCEEYQKILIESCNLKPTKIGSNEYNTCFYVVYGGNEQVKRIMEYLYKNATVYLDRKLKKFQEHYNLTDEYIANLTREKSTESKIIITKEFLNLL